MLTSAAFLSLLLLAGNIRVAICLRPPLALSWTASVCLVLSLSGCRAVSKMAAPSNARDWSPDQAVLPFAQIEGDAVTLHHVRHCRYFSVGQSEEYVVNYEQRRVNLADLQAVDFFMVPFEGTPSLAHTMLSFEFAPPDGPPEHIAVSVETRKEEGETYAAWKGSARQYELMYVVADESDVIKVRTNHRNEDVYLYRTTATPDQARQLFVDVMGRVNELASRPEFYDTLTNNCTTNLVRHINRIHPHRIRYDYHVLLPGYSDRLAYKEGLIERHGSFEDTKARAYVNPRAWSLAENADFSAGIRRR